MKTLLLFILFLCFSYSTIAQNLATFNGTDITTQGAWNGVYGKDGHILADQEICDACNPFPPYVAFGPLQLGSTSSGSMGSHLTSTHAYTAMVQGVESLMGPEPLNAGNTNFYQCNYTYTGMAPQDLQNGVGDTSPKGSMWYACGGQTFYLELWFSGPHNFEQYAVDRTGTRREQIQVVDGDSGIILYDSGSFSFTNGVWYRWTLSGHIKIKIIDTSGSGNWFGACVNGVFFDPYIIKNKPLPPSNVTGTVN